jgi:FMN phosphatase YigB (HAD superfamily)
LHVTAEEAVFIGDSPLEDIKGAQEIGMKTVFVQSQFYSLKDLQIAAKSRTSLLKTCTKFTGTSRQS